MQKQLTKKIIIKEKPSRVYQEWANFENFPTYMRHVTAVTKTGENTSQWVVQMPDGKNLKWEAETTLVEENKRIAWSSKDRGDFSTSGQATFTSLPAKDETQVTITMQFSADGDSILPSDALMASSRAWRRISGISNIISRI
ncbi:MAG TPA: SRPBCC family protein [Anaerolineales bacterium]|nr:SRPBCC family protein [Anaerolineales bacterium]